jgi:predicted Co/Zn/Cd cation transporter (cation efflux family)
VGKLKIEGAAVNPYQPPEHKGNRVDGLTLVEVMAFVQTAVFCAVGMAMMCMFAAYGNVFDGLASIFFVIAGLYSLHAARVLVRENREARDESDGGREGL